MAQEASMNLLKAYRIEKQNKNPTTIFEAINNLKLAESLCPTSLEITYELGLC